MIHHYSIPVQEPKKVAGILARLFDATITPFEPYKDACIIWTGDEYGTAIELYPSGTEMMPEWARQILFTTQRTPDFAQLMQQSLLIDQKTRYLV